MPEVSVIMPSFNHGKFIAEALDSVLSQTFINWECIIVDNGSVDNTKEIVQKYLEKDSRFKYFCQENKGVSSARNVGIKNSSGKYLLPLDSDDKIGGNYLMEAVKVIEGDDKIKIVYCEAELFGELNGKWDLPAFTIENILMENVIFCTSLYRRSDYDKTKGYNESMTTGFEDWDFWLELLQDGGSVFRIPEIYFYYRIRKESRNGRLSKLQIKMLRKVIYENHKALYEKYFDTSSALFEWYLKKEAYRQIELSKEYRFGKFVLKPFRRLKGLFTK